MVFFEYKSVIKDCISGSKFLYLGHKGSGKSTIGKHIQLKFKNNHQYSIKNIYLKDFPFSQLARVAKSEDNIEKLPDSWAFLLLLNVIDSLLLDQGLFHNDPNWFQSGLQYLKSEGLLGSSSLKQLIGQTSKKTFRFKIPQIAEYGEEFEGGKGEFYRSINALRKLVSGCRTNMDHFLILDGLDDVLTSKERQFRSIGALIFEVDRLNQFFSENGINVKIIVLCRTDVFEKIDGPNKNKIRQDYSVNLFWYDNTRDPEKSDLFELVELRASNIFKRNTFFNDFFIGHIIIK